VLVEPLARGGMGELHLAVTASGKLCVVKQVLSYLTDQEHIQRFVDETNVMAKLSHGNLVPVLESGVVDGQYFLAMDYVEGKNLRQVWTTVTEQKQVFPLNLALYVVKELCRGLGFAHSASDLGLVHRDVSPPNVLLSYPGEVRLADFGLAVSTLKVQKTSPGILLGKLPYMSPEQARGNILDGRSDIYAVGVILWELVTGQRRFDAAADQTNQLRQAMDPTFVAPSQLNAALPGALDLIARRALALQREDRYPDAETLRREIATVLAGVDPTTDAATLQRFLADLYGDAVDRERMERQQRLETMAAEIKQLLGDEEQAGEPDALTAMMGYNDGAAPRPRRKRRDPTAEIVPGHKLDDKYLIHELVGEGGMGKIYRATHLGIERTVALKVLLPEYRNIASVVERFQMEARAASRVGHPNVVEIFDSGTTSSGLLYYAMEFLEGTDLADLLHDDRTLEVNQCLRITTQICDAMEAAHAAGVIHRDLKPENIYLVVRDGAPDFVKVVDFGIARIEGSRSQTLPGLAVGTPEYMSPEQARGGPIDRRTDIYSVGVMLHEMLAGTLPPRPGPDDTSLASLPSLRERREDVPPGLEAAIRLAQEPDPDLRPSSMAKLGYELRKILDGRAAAVASMLNISGAAPALTDAVGADSGSFEAVGFTAQMKSRSRRRRWLPWAMGGAAVLLAIVAALFFLSRPRAPTTHLETPSRPDAGAQTKLAPPVLDGGAPRARRSRDGDGPPARRRPRKGRRKSQKKAVRLEGTLDPFAK